MTASERVRARRERLLGWLRERPEHQGLTAGEIAPVSGLYDGLSKTTVLNDLYALAYAEPYDVRWARASRRGQEVSVWFPSEARA